MGDAGGRETHVAGGGISQSLVTSLLESSKSQGLVFRDLNIDIATKRILWNVWGQASPGSVLAVMGPSGSGKTTLLNGLAGQARISSGHVTLNGVKLSTKLKRQISYVLQEDVFFPNLSLRETLRYSALLRLPHEIGFREKLAKVEDIINVLRLQDCAQTNVGNALVRGLSGGEKKRTNIGCELLTDPTMLLLDEPTSGLDSSSALNLMQTLCSLAKDRNKIIVASVHQPSSQLYHMFDHLLLLAKGKVAYFGDGSQALTHFSSRGLHCTMHYNPADFMLEMVTQDESRKLVIGEDPVQDTTAVKRVWWRRLLLWRRPVLTQKKSFNVEEYPSSPRFPQKSTLSETQERTVDDGGFVGNGDIGGGVGGGVDEDCMDEISVKVAEEGVSTNDSASSSSSSASSSSASSGQWSKYRKWPTPWYWQFLVLTVRTFRQSRHVILSKLNWIQTILLAVLVSLVWFQIPDDEKSIPDRLGFLFFIVIYLNFTSLIVATFTLPSEHLVISKERKSGSFHLSAYYVAKLLSELPLVIILPTVFLIITYWAVGINGWVPFFGILLVTLISCIVAQGLGLLIGAIFMNLQRSLVAATVILLGMLLLGGFYVERFPYWLRWAQYASFITYAYDSTLALGFMDLTLRCDGGDTVSLYAACTPQDDGWNGTMSASGANGTAIISGAEVSSQVGGIALPWYWSTLIITAFGIVYRIAAYICLRFLHKKQ